MTAGDLISLLGYYIGVLAIALAFFATQIESWRARVLALKAEWSAAEQKTHAQIKLKQHGDKTTLKDSKPLFAIFAPVVLGLVLLALGYMALLKSKADVSPTDLVI